MSWRTAIASCVRIFLKIRTIVSGQTDDVSQLIRKIIRSEPLNNRNEIRYYFTSVEFVIRKIDMTKRNT